ncbi:MAG: hypothetical protein WED11_12530 [Natronospirillum sp.]
MFNNPRRLMLIAAIAIGAGLLFGWEHLVLFGIAPILISLLPCLVMCGLGLCMMSKSKKSDNTVDKEVGSTEVVAPANSVASASGKTSASAEF